VVRVLPSRAAQSSLSSTTSKGAHFIFESKSLESFHPRSYNTRTHTHHETK